MKIRLLQKIKLLINKRNKDQLKKLYKGYYKKEKNIKVH